MRAEMGKRIERIRKEMDLNKEQFAEQLGISGQFLGVVEKGKSCLSYEKLQKLCDISGYTSDYILFGKEDYIKRNAQLLLNEVNEKQIQDACTILSKIAIFIKNNNII